MGRDAWPLRSSGEAFVCVQSMLEARLRGRAFVGNKLTTETQLAPSLHAFQRRVMVELFQGALNNNNMTQG